MSTEPIPGPASSPSQSWFDRLGLSGKLLLIGGLAGVIVSFLPLISVTINMPGVVAGGDSAMVVEDWRGKVCLLGYIGAVVLTLALYPPGGLKQKPLCWAAVGVGVMVTVVAFWLLILALDSVPPDAAALIGDSFKVSPGIGAFLNVVTGALVAVGGFLKARDEKLI